MDPILAREKGRCAVCHAAISPGAEDTIVKIPENLPGIDPRVAGRWVHVECVPIEVEQAEELKARF